MGITILSPQSSRCKYHQKQTSSIQKKLDLVKVGSDILKLTLASLLSQLAIR